MMKIACAVFIGLFAYQFVSGLLSLLFPKEVDGWVQDKDGSWYLKGHRYDDSIV